MFKAVIRRIMSVMLVTVMICTSSGVASCFAETVSDDGVGVETESVSEDKAVPEDTEEPAPGAVSGDSAQEGSVGEDTVSSDSAAPVIEEVEDDEPEIVGGDLTLTNYGYFVDFKNEEESLSSYGVSGLYFYFHPLNPEDKYNSKYCLQIRHSSTGAADLSTMTLDKIKAGTVDFYWGGRVSITGHPDYINGRTPEMLLKNTVEFDITTDSVRKVKAISKDLITACPNLKSVKFDSLTSLPVSGFYGCTKLETVDLSACTELTEIPAGNDGCFEKCSALKTVKLNNTLQSIGTYAFRLCSSLTEIDIPSSVTFIGSAAFNSSGLKQVTIQKRTSDLSVASGAFNNCKSLSKILFYGTSADKTRYIKIGSGDQSPLSNDANWTIIDPSKMCGDNLTYTLERVSGTDYEYTLHISGKGDMYDFTDSSPAPWNSEYYRFRICRIIIDKGVTSIGDHAFDYSVCHPYEKTSSSTQATRCLSVTIPEGVMKIGKYAFKDQINLYNIFLPRSVCDIRTGAFMNCTGLQGVCFWCTDYALSIGPEAFSGCLKSTDNTKVMYFTFPKRVSLFGNDAFKGLRNIKVYCPFDEYVYDNTPRNDGGDALIRAIISTGCSYVKSDNGNASDGYKFIKSRYGFAGEVDPSNKDKKVMYELDSAGALSITGGGNMLSFDDPDYYPWSKVSGITALATVTVNSKNIGKGAFKNRTSITRATIQGSSVTIEDEAFYGCTKAVITGFSNTGVIRDYAFYGCKAMASAISLTDSHTLQGDSQFRNSGITGLTVAMGTKSIPKNAFAGCSGLTSLTVTSVGNIEANAFGGCSKLSALSIKKAGTIMADAFTGLSGLSTLTVGDTTAVNSGAFKSTALSTVTLENVPGVKSGAFSGCTNLGTVEIKGTLSGSDVRPVKSGYTNPATGLSTIRRSGFMPNSSFSAK